MKEIRFDKPNPEGLTESEQDELKRLVAEQKADKYTKMFPEIGRVPISGHFLIDLTDYYSSEDRQEYLDLFRQAKLTTKQVYCAWHLFLLNKSMRQIARNLSINESTVRRQIERVKKKIKKVAGNKLKRE